MHILAIVIGDEVDQQLMPFRYFDDAENLNAKFEWYKIGGYWEKGLFKLKEPRRPSYIHMRLGRRPVSDVNQARVKEVDIEALKEIVPFAYVYNSQWRDKGWGDEKVSDEEWREEYRLLIESLPQDTLLTAVDIHL